MELVEKAKDAQLARTKNGEKTENGQFISSYACQAESVDEEFMLSEREYERLTGRNQKAISLLIRSGNPLNREKSHLRKRIR